MKAVQDPAMQMEGYEATLLSALWSAHVAHLIKKEQHFYRVNTNGKAHRGKTIVVSKYGFGTSIDHDVLVAYDDIEELPEWMQRKLAVLVTIPFDVPTEELEGIGRRVSQHVYWVYASFEETIEEGSGGTNTRKKGKTRRPKAT